MMENLEGKELIRTPELLDLFEPNEGSVNMYYGRIGNGKTYNATADILDLLKQGQVVYCNWVINFDGFDERSSWTHAFMNFVFFRKNFYFFPKENLHIFKPDDVSVELLSNLNDCEIFIDEGQWIFDSYEGTKFSKEKRRLILHTRHLNRSLNIISQRPMAIQKTARAQVNRFYKCVKKIGFPVLIFARYEYQDLKDDDVDESEPLSTKVYFARKRILNAYNSKYLRAGVPSSQEVYFKAFEFDFKARWLLLKSLTINWLRTLKRTKRNTEDTI